MAENKRTQANRLLAIQTELGDDALLLRGFHMTEELGRPFTVELDLRSETPDIEFDKLIGTNCTIRLEQTDKKTRFVNGYISRIVQEGAPSAGRANQYRATVVPWLWFLTKSGDCRIFQDKSIPDIVQEVFRDHGFSDFENKCTGTYAKREYVVQYRETAFNFVSRLMEEAGIYYYFVHENGKHTLRMCDDATAHVTVPGYENIPFIEQASTSTGVERVWDWVVEKQVQTQTFALRDFDFKAPSKTMDSQRATAFSLAHFKAEVFDFPGGYTELADGETIANIRAEESTSQLEVCRARGDVRGLTAGARFTLEGFSRTDQNRDYIVTGMACHAETDQYSSGKGGDGELFQCGFSVIPADRNFRAARVTPRPIISGPQTAIVMAPKDEEIQTDEFGRVRVWFPWDRHAAEEHSATCWIRVAQVWAGKGWGGMFIPRKGQEVIVEFLEGDPDRPIITGRVYNGANAVPYALPGNKTMSTLKSNSSKGGEGFNELRFEDLKGSEQVFLHAEKQLDIRVKADRYETIGGNRHLVVEANKYEHIKADRSEKVDGNHKEEISGDRNVKVSGKEAVEITGSKSLTVNDNVIEIFKADQSTQVTGEVHIKADTIILDATTNITIKVAGSYLAIDSSSLDIKSKDVTFKADSNMKQEASSAFEMKGANLKAEGTADAALKSPKTTVDGSGTCTISGGSISIG